MTRHLDSAGLMLEREVFNRKLIIFVHVLLGFLSGIYYLSHVNLVGFPYWRSRAGIGLMFVAAPAIAPYVVSAVYSLRVATYRRVRTLLFLTVVTGVSVLMALLFSGALGIDIRGADWFFVAGTQAGIYVWAAELLLHVV